MHGQNVSCDIVDTSSTSGGTAISPVSSLDVDILASPNLPDFVDIPPVGDKSTTKFGIAYIGSNPSFEARLKGESPDLNIKSVDLNDSQGKSFSNIPFSVIGVSNSPGKIILTLTLPETVAKGRATFILNTANMDMLNGEIEGINFFQTKIPGKKKNVGEPVISRLSVKKSSDEIVIDVSGRGFVGRKMFYEDGNTTKYVENPKDSPNTFVTVFPSSLNPEVVKTVVSSGGGNAKIKLKLQEKLQEVARAVLVIATPRGIVSRQFDLKP